MDIIISGLDIASYIVQVVYTEKWRVCKQMSLKYGTHILL